MRTTRTRCPAEMGFWLTASQTSLLPSRTFPSVKTVVWVSPAAPTNLRLGVRTRFAQILCDGFVNDRDEQHKAWSLFANVSPKAID